MRMSHIYQPLMLKTLLQHDGHASNREIAAAFLREDQSQLDYYEEITKRMPGRVLQRHGLVERAGDGYALPRELNTLSTAERAELVRLCDDAIDGYKAKRGATIWEHRAVGLGQVPGRFRYDTLKRAGFRCELCGIPASERALDVNTSFRESTAAPTNPRAYRPSVGCATRTREPGMRRTSGAFVTHTKCAMPPVPSARFPQKRSWHRTRSRSRFGIAFPSLPFTRWSSRAGTWR